MRKSTILLRSMARKLGLMPLVRWLFPSRRNENEFSDTLMSIIREGDTVWDIGANVGDYTRRFIDAVGPSGVVVAFEPSPRSAACLPRPDEVATTLHVVKAGLGNLTGTASMRIDEDETSPTNRIVNSQVAGDATIDVAIYRADDAQQQLNLPSPAVIKLDVEGSELECIKGMENLLRDKQLRAIFVEVHFGFLAERGQPFAPVEIEESLKENGFSVSWIDASHIQAIRA